MFHISHAIIPYSISFLYFLSRPARSRGNENATGKGFQLKDVTQFTDFKVFSLYLEVRE